MIVAFQKESTDVKKTASILVEETRSIYIIIPFIVHQIWSPWVSMYNKSNNKWTGNCWSCQSTRTESFKSQQGHWICIRVSHITCGFFWWRIQTDLLVCGQLQLGWNPCMVVTNQVSYKSGMETVDQQNMALTLNERATSMSSLIM